MNWKFWRKWREKKNQEKEFLLRTREAMLEASYIMRLFEKISTRYFEHAIDESTEVKKALFPHWGLESLDITNIWKNITEIEQHLRKEHGLDFLDAAQLETLRFNLLDTDIKRAERKHEWNLRTVRPTGFEVDRAPSDASRSTQ